MMKISRLYTYWIMFISLLYTANTCVQTIMKSFFGKVPRPWVDQTLHIWTQRVLNAAKIDCTVFNPNQVAPKPGQSTIIICNHSTHYDIPLSYTVFPKHSIRMLAKIELFKIPLFGRAMRAAEVPCINRTNKRLAIQNLEKVHRLLESGIVMWIAPEGTRSSNGKLTPLKKGPFITAIQANATIIPIAIRGANKILPARTFQLSLNQKVEIHVGQPIDASQYTLEHKEELIETATNSLKKLLGDA